MPGWHRHTRLSHGVGNADGLVHCRSEQEAKALKAELQARLAECRLEMHPTKTRIVYCKDDKPQRPIPERQI
jgi:RNA-directed DNA polymerase